MNRLAFILGLTTLVFASTTVYFAHAFHAERERRAQPSPTARVTEDTVLSSATRVERPASDEPPDAAAAAPVCPPPGTYVRDTAAELESSKMRLKRLTDPSGRAEHLANLTAMMRAERYIPAKGAGWTREELDRVVAMLAERSLQRGEVRLRCDLTPKCPNPPRPDAENKAADRQEMVQLLGEEKVARFERYLATGTERGTVEFMRPRLSEGGPLSDAQTERLITAVAEENRRFTEALKLQGPDVYITTFGFGSAAIPGAGGLKTVEGRTRMMDSAAEYARNLHDRAAEILTPAQLAMFDEMQGETLRSVRETTRFNEIESGRTP